MYYTCIIHVEPIELKLQTLRRPIKINDNGHKYDL